MSEHAANIDRFRSLGATVVGVSTDQVPAQQAFARHCGAEGKVTFLSDFRHRAIKEYGVAVEEGPTANRRAVFVIDRDGVVRYKHVYAPGRYDGIEPELEALRGVVG